MIEIVGAPSCALPAKCSGSELPVAPGPDRREVGPPDNQEPAGAN